MILIWSLFFAAANQYEEFVGFCKNEYDGYLAPEKKINNSPMTKEDCLSSCSSYISLESGPAKSCVHAVNHGNACYVNLELAKYGDGESGVTCWNLGENSKAKFFKVFWTFYTCWLGD